MFVGVLRLTLHLPEPGSLKSKRHLLRSAIDRVKARFNVSISEVGANDLWQKSVVGSTRWRTSSPRCTEGRSR